MKAKLYADLTRQFLRFLEGLNPDEIEALDTQKKRVEIRISGTRRPDGKVQRPDISIDDLSKLADTLRTSETNEHADNLLKGLSKEQLTKLSRILDLPVQKSESIGQFRERIVQSTVGFRLRSKAIQG